MASADYISREAAILEIQRHGVGCFDPEEFTPEQAERFVISRLKSIPAADVRPKWISVEERLPELCQNVLVSDGKRSGEGWLDRYDWHDPNREDVVYTSPQPRDFWCIPGCKVDEDHVTHWQPLPEPPNCGAKMEAGE